MEVPYIASCNVWPSVKLYGSCPVDVGSIQSTTHWILLNATNLLPDIRLLLQVSSAYWWKSMIIDNIGQYSVIDEVGSNHRLIIVPCQWFSILKTDARKNGESQLTILADSIIFWYRKPRKIAMTQVGQQCSLHRIELIIMENNKIQLSELDLLCFSYYSRSKQLKNII